MQINHGSSLLRDGLKNPEAFYKSKEDNQQS
jgi:hypothetical protein